jgi:N-methylhydantoinase B/oxoprolinase/acetone carboxylase alpha subunit
VTLSQQVAALERENQRLSNLVDSLTDQMDSQNLLQQIADVVGNSKEKWRGHYNTLPSDLQELIKLHDRYEKKFSGSILENHTNGGEDDQ